ncbi:MAG: YihA family ribosome biogenesis GTP-binding protein [Clostridia bacterium]|nr:YihA family ribosome biogenesis GTP-binding protein [Clostridia bacterium]MBQ4131202.1 YihA family ribosome biogenesis GTP-binding protein [Clostridia bacterium]MBQ9919644.1 YihA family ribosome biogenesis GTP-binding protein [Clostridia bacterium]
MNYNNVSFEAAFGDPKQFFRSNIPELCFAGRSNVGKSSLINKVLGRKSFARVSTKPGKTITINFYRLDGIRLVDLPGYGYAKISANEKMRFARLMETYFNEGRNIKTVFSLIDMRHSPTADDIDMLNFLLQTGLPFTVVLTKSDKLNKTEREKRLLAFKEELSFLPEDIEVIPFSAEKGEGVERVRAIIEEKAE